MNLKLTAKNNMYKAVLAFFEESAAGFAGFARAQTEIATFTNLNQALDGYINQQSGTSKGITQQKNTLFETMAALAVKNSRKALVYAADQGDEPLSAVFDVQPSELAKTTETAALAVIQNIYTALQPLSGTLDNYRVTAGDIAAVGAAINAFKAAGGTPETAKAAIEAGTKGINTTMPLIDKSLHLLDDLIIHGMDDEPGLVTAYQKVRRIKATGNRHTGLIATIAGAESGQGIEGATMLVQELNKKAVSDILGVARIESMKPGIYHIVFSAAGYAVQTQVLKIEQGKTLEEEVRMVRE